MQAFKSFLFPTPVECKTKSIVTDGLHVENEIPSPPKIETDPKKSKSLQRRRTTIKKVLPTVSDGGQNAFVAGVEGLSKKNAEKHEGQPTAFRMFHTLITRGVLMIPAMTALAPLEFMRRRSDQKHLERVAAKKELQAKGLVEDPVEQEVVKSTTVWDMDGYEGPNMNDKSAAPADYEKPEHRIKSMKGERLNARHFSSNCAIELELFKVCLKDRFHSGNKCSDLRENFKKCQESS